MPQSLIRTPKDAAQPLQVHGRTLLAAHEQIASILRSRLGNNQGELLAQPRVAADGSVQWLTNLNGSVKAAADLPEEQRLTLVKRADRLVNDILGLAEQMNGEGPTGVTVAQILRSAVLLPPGDWLFSVDGRPVYVMWGHGAPGTPMPLPATSEPPPTTQQAAVPPPLSPPAPPAPQPAVADVTPPPSGLSAAPVAKATAARRGWRWWALAFGLLVLAVLMLLGLRRCSLPQGDLSSQITQAEERNAMLAEQLARKRAASLQCVPDAPAPAPETSPPAAGASQPEPPAASSPEPGPPALTPAPSAPKPSAPVAQRDEPPPMPTLPSIDPAPQAKAAPPTRTPAPPPGKQACKPRQPGDEPEVLMIVDASGSMRAPMGGMSRLDAAKRAADSMIRGLPSDVDVGLVDFDACNRVHRDRFYKAPERGALIGEINALRPKAGTPLAQAIERAGRVASDSADAVLVVVSDGGDSCGGDPCGTARRVRAQKPGIVINVIDLSDNAADRQVLQCVASAGGGRLLRPGDPLDLQQKMKEAVGSASCPP